MAQTDRDLASIAEARSLARRAKAAAPVVEADEDEALDDQSDDEEAPDELAETPEFLEDAPEHDKLWFEQKPPKDFDF